MMRFFLAFICIILFGACNQKEVYSPPDLRKLSNDEIIEKVRNYDLPDFSVLFRNEKGLVLSADSLYRQYRPNFIFSDTYVNEENEVVEIVIREDIPIDSALMDRLKEAAESGPEVKPALVDCTDLDNILTNLERADQALRVTGKPINRKQDLKNLTIAMGIIDQCGIPSTDNLNGYTHRGLWLVFQHAPYRYRKQYFHHFQKAAEHRQMPRRHVAMMEDRILLEEGKKQLYGSQVRMGPNGYELSPLKDPEYVNQRRLLMGMGTLQDYLSNYAIDFDIPQKQN